MLDGKKRPFSPQNMQSWRGHNYKHRQNL